MMIINKILACAFILVCLILKAYGSTHSESNLGGKYYSEKISNNFQIEKYLHGGQIKTASFLKTGKTKGYEKRPPRYAGDEFTIKKLGMKITPDWREDIRSKNSDYVHRVLSVQIGGPAFLAGLQPGDLIQAYRSPVFTTRRSYNSNHITKKVNPTNPIKPIAMPIEKGLKKGDTVIAFVIWSKKPGTPSEFGGKERFLLSYEGRSSGGWISNGGNNGVATKYRKMLPELAEAKVKIERRRVIDGENDDILRATLREKLLAIDLSSCSTKNLDQELAANNVRPEEFTQAIFTKRFVPPYVSIADAHKALRRCAWEKIQPIVAEYKAKVSDGNLWNNIYDSTLADKEWIKRYGKVPDEYATENVMYLTPIRMFEEIHDYISRSGKVINWEKSDRNEYFVLRMEYLVSQHGYSKAYQLVTEEGWLPPDSNKSDQEIISYILDGIESGVIDQQYASVLVDRRVRTINSNDVYNTTIAQVLFSGRSQAVYEIDDLNARKYRLRNALYAINGKTCQAPRTVKFCRYEVNRRTDYLGKNFFYDHYDVENTCSGGCSGVNGWCDQATGRRYASYVAAETNHCRSIGIDEIRSLLER